ncbi:MAG: tetratricopeptide repeat protein [Pseudomonadota bacterium]
MSVINRMLRDLDSQGAQTPAPSRVRAVALPRAGPAGRPLALVGLLLALGVAAWALWPAGHAPSSPSSDPAAAAVAEPQAEPRLRLSDSLSRLPDEPASAPLPPPVAAAKPVPSPTPPGAQTPAPPTLQQTLPRVRLDTRLPDPPAPRLSKEVRQPGPREQAEELWRQAERFRDMGQAREARSRLESALALASDLSPLRQSLAVHLLESGDTARAESLLREGQVRHPDEAWYPRARAQLLLQKGEAAPAAALLRPGLGASSDANDWALYAAAQAQAGQAGEAARGYQEALARQPAQGNWWLGLALAREQLGQRAEAAAAFQRASQSGLTGEARRFAQEKAGQLAGDPGSR